MKSSKEVNSLDDSKILVAWCKSVIHHAALNAIRGQKRYRERTLLNDVEKYHDTFIDGANRNFILEQREWAWMLETLSWKERSILKLLYIHGYSQTEIASLMHTTQQHVSVIQRHALKLLRESW